MLARTLGRSRGSASTCFADLPISILLQDGLSPRTRLRITSRSPGKIGLWRESVIHHRHYVTPAAPKPPKKPSSTKQSLAKILTSDSICYKRGSSSPSPPSKDDKHTLAAAQRLFLRGSPRLLYSASKLSEHPANPGIVPEILVIGASNAGKSTFLNALLGVASDGGMAMVSRTPGSTMTQNVYGVGLPRGWDHRNVASWTRKPDAGGLYLVDSPGYGFGSAKDYHDALSRYLEKRTSCRGVVLLLPLNKDLRPIDTGVLDHLASMNKRTLILLTKADTCKVGWAEKWPQTADVLRDSMSRIDAQRGRHQGESARWKEGDAWNPDIYVIAAGAKGRTASSNAAGIGGARRAILELAGYNLRGGVSEDPSVASYDGDIVPFEDIQYKGQ